jgi:hypothetical protein
VEGLAALAGRAGWDLERHWVRADPAFAIVLLRARA